MAPRISGDVSFTAAPSAGVLNATSCDAHGSRCRPAVAAQEPRPLSSTKSSRTLMLSGPAFLRWMCVSAAWHGGPPLYSRLLGGGGGLTGAHVTRDASLQHTQLTAMRHDGMLIPSLRGISCSHRRRGDDVARSTARWHGSQNGLCGRLNPPRYSATIDRQARDPCPLTDEAGAVAGMFAGIVRPESSRF
jgi:hypothetical protein